ncbi:VWA domain-containing protein [Nakamurella sp. YIM 132087]|uniref:VWA domain-containing protein n=1 Tax=Nakamurella alba TaxID=2665158 RepID=A0A7K1FMV3_9ACTN|nr:VWA domain-containing protein [Nakamurella alba]MTD15497.1 VWA domain-containing protein [Nakamurella alba]
MEEALLGFIACLRGQGVRVSTAEAVDAARCAAQPSILGDRVRLHAALRAALVTSASSVSTFDDVFALYFSLRPVPVASRAGEVAAADSDLGGTAGESGEMEDFSLVDGTEGAPPISNSPSAESDMSQYFDPEALSEGYNLDDDADIVNLASMTDEISFSPGGGRSRSQGMKVQLDVSRTHGIDAPGSLSPATGTAMDLDLTDDEEGRLLRWLGTGPSGGAPREDDAMIRGLLDRLPEYLVEHLRRLADLRRTRDVVDHARIAVLDEVSVLERQKLEESLRRIATTLKGGLAQRRKVDPRGRVDPARTARRSLRYDGVPFRPVTVARVRERSRVVVLADVSLSVRATARFTLHMVHGMQSIFGHVRTYAFVDTVREITQLFAHHPLEHALGLVFGGDVLDTDANSDYGRVFEDFLADSGSSLDRRTSVVVLGDGRSNGKDPRMDAFAEIAHRARRVVWLTPEPSYSWGLGTCDLPKYAGLCERVEVVRDLSALERTSLDLALAT